MSNGKRLQKNLKEYQVQKAYKEDNKQITGMMNQDETKIPEKKKKEYASYIDMLMYTIHGEKTRDGIIEMLSSDAPERSVPATALRVNKSVEDGIKKKGQKVANDTKAAGASYLVGDLVELGNTANLWDKQVNADEMKGYLQETMSKYIHTGIKEGTIDPVELQKEVEPLLTDEQRAVGDQLSQRANLPGQATSNMAVDKMIKDKLTRERAKTQQGGGQGV